MYHTWGEWFDEIVYLPFENIFIPAPAHYQDVLKTEYGDMEVNFFDYFKDAVYNKSKKRDTYKVGAETLNLLQWSGWRPKTHSHCRINCEKLVEGWLRSHPSTLL